MKIKSLLVIGLLVFGHPVAAAEPARKAEESGEGFNQKQTAALVDAFWSYRTALADNNGPKIGLSFKKMHEALVNGADPNVTIEYTQTHPITQHITRFNEPMLDFSTRYYDEALARLLLESGARTDHLSSHDGLSPFHRLLQSLGTARKLTDPQVKMAKLFIEFFIEKSKNLNEQSKSGSTPLMIAINQVNARPFPKPQDFDGALVAERMRIVGSLINHLCEQHKSLDIVNKGGFTALLFAACNNQPDIVKILLARGASPAIDAKAAAYFREHPLDPAMKALLASAEGGAPKKRAQALEQERKIAAEPFVEHKLPAQERAEGEAPAQDDQPGAQAEEVQEDEQEIEPGAQIEGAL